MNDFRMGQFDIIPDSNEPNHDNAASGVLWVPDLDTWRISTASGVRELRTGHGLIHVFRSADATSQTFTTLWTDVIWDNTGIIDEQYYTFTNGEAFITIKHPGIYRVSYCQSVNVSVGTSRSSAAHRVELDGVNYAGSRSSSYHRTAGGGLDSGSASFFLIMEGTNLQVSVASQRQEGTSTLQFVVGCNCSIERISPLRHPSSPSAD